MRFYKNDITEEVFYEEEYNSLFGKESKEYDKSVEELNCKCIELDLKENEKITLLNLINLCENTFNYDILDYINEKEILRNVSISCKITKYWDLNIIFDILKINKDDLLNSMLKITKIELI